MKVTTAEIHKNDFSSSSFYDGMNHCVKRIREAIHIYKKLRKVNTTVFGHIHALRLLSEKPYAHNTPINLVEEQEWEEILLKYYNRIQKKIPENIRSKFEKNLTEDLEFIVSKAIDTPKYLWEKKVLEREIRIRVKSQELKDKYELLIKQKEEYKDRLGNALHNYIDDCLKKLDETEATNNLKKDNNNQKTIAFQPTFFKSKANEFTYLINDFSFFLTKEELENDTEINAYDIEKAIKKFLKDIDVGLLKNLNFDCESSMFSVQSSNIKHLSALNNYILIYIESKNNR